MNKKTIKTILFFLFLGYCIIMLILLFDRNVIGDADDSYKEIMRGKINLEPFKTIKLFLNVLENSSNTTSIIHAFINLVGNVVLFIPLGIFLPFFFKVQNNFIIFLLSTLSIICIVELAQLVTLRGSLDIDDLILNMIGIIFGYIIYKVFHLFSKNR